MHNSCGAKKNVNYVLYVMERKKNIGRAGKERGLVQKKEKCMSACMWLSGTVMTRAAA